MKLGRHPAIEQGDVVAEVGIMAQMKVAKPAVDQSRAGIDRADQLPATIDRPCGRFKPYAGTGNGQAQTGVPSAWSC